MAKQRNWTRTETLLAFRLYCYTPFGKLHQSNPDIIELAQRIGRTPSAVGMKACNFASLDPLHQARGVVGLANRSKLEEQIWEEFAADSESIADEAERAHETYSLTDSSNSGGQAGVHPEGPTEVTRVVKTRRAQRFFRQAVLTSYGNRCALTGIAIPSLLNASHIIPWSSSVEHRADPCNGICLNALHDRAFDRGLITFDEKYQVVISPQVSSETELGKLLSQFIGIRGAKIHIPERFGPNLEALDYHRNNIYLQS